MKTTTLLLAALVCMAWAPYSFADFISSSGVECVAKFGVNARYDSNYITNGSTTDAIEVNCPLNLGAVSTISTYQSQVVVRYADYSSSGSISCEVHKFSATLQRLDGSTMYSCGQAGGCPGNYAPSSTELGGYLLLTPPSNTFSIDDSITVRCLVPPSQAGLQSGIIVYYAQ